MAAKHTGGCLCGAIRYEIGAPITELRSWGHVEPSSKQFLGQPDAPAPK